MGLVAMEVADAQSDMDAVSTAADAIAAAIKATTPWLTDQTWTGQAATAWSGEWNALYKQVQSLLANQLPGAENQVISQVRQQAEQQQARQHPGGPTPE